MNTDLIIIDDYCRMSNIERQFLDMLDDGGLIEIENIAGDYYLSSSQIMSVEKYAHLYYDLSINIEGIDAISHLLDRIESMQQEITSLKRKINALEYNCIDK